MKIVFWGIFITIVIVLTLIASQYLKEPDGLSGSAGEIVELTFEFDKKTGFGEYYFDLANGEGSTYPLCFCLKERNMFPPECSGDVKYIYYNTPGTMCVPLNIAKGRCSVSVMSSSSYATIFLIPLEYKWTKPVEKIVMGISIPGIAPEGARLVVQVDFFKRDDLGQLKFFKKLSQSIRVRNAGDHQVNDTVMDTIKEKNKNN
ncbi:MAG: hypothetical protein WKF97_19820 [Chitinophagaceae bacterium]